MIKMKPTHILSTLAVLLLLVLAAPGVQASPLNRVVNGDFETLAAGHTLGANGGYFCRSGSTCVSNVANWSSICHQGANCGGGGTPDSLLFANTNGSAFNGNIGLWARGSNGTSSGGVPNSPTGGNFVAFDGALSYNASISQVITGLTPGATYVLTFWQGAAQQSGTRGATTEYWQVTFAGQTRDSTVMNNVDRGWVAWNQQTMSFTAQNASETLTFLSMGGPDALPPVVLLDGVSLVDAPEPASFALIGAALIALPWLASRAKKKV